MENETRAKMLLCFFGGLGMGILAGLTIWKAIEIQDMLSFIYGIVYLQVGTVILSRAFREQEH